jgi:putative ABC transport system permease protein
MPSSSGAALPQSRTSDAPVADVALPGVVLAGIGSIAGLAAAVAAIPLVRHFVWGVSTTDPATYAGVTILLLAVAGVASVVPALRILRLDPAITLRQE